MKVFRQDVRIIATAYVRAESEEAAKKLIYEAMRGAALDLPLRNASFDARREYGDLLICGAPFSELPEGLVTVSPAMTVDRVIGDEPEVAE